MAISKMKLVNILADSEYLNDVLLKPVELGYLHPEPTSESVDSVHGLTTPSDENPIADVLTYSNEMLQDMDMTPPVKDVKDGAYDLEDIHKHINPIHEHFEDRAAVRHELETIIRGNRDALTQVRNIESIDLNLDSLFECKYVKIRFGKLPIGSVKKLRYYRSRPFVFRSFSMDDMYSWRVYLTTAKYEGDADNVLSSLYSERIRIPEFVHENPVQAKESLQEEVDSDLKQLQHVNEVIEALKAEYTDNFVDIKTELEFIDRAFEVRRCVLGLGKRFSITGFVIEEDVLKLKEPFSNLKEVEIEVRSAHSDKQLSSSTKLKSGWFARPFSTFVEMYDAPEYEGVDPTPFVASTYSLLFGIMFGDSGQGFILILAGYLLYK